MIDEPFIIFWQDSEFLRRLQTQTKTSDPIVCLEPHRAEKIAQKFHPSPWIIFVGQLADSANIDTGANELGRNFKSSCGCVRILKRAGVGRNGDVKIFR